MAKLIEDWVEQSVLVSWGHLTEDACHLDKSFPKLCMHLSHLVHTKKSKLQKLTNFRIEQTHKETETIETVEEHITVSSKSLLLR